MLKILEKDIEKAIIQYLNLFPDVFAFKLPDQRAYRDGAYRACALMPKGLPDVVFIKNGVTYWVEVKTRLGRPSEAQKRIHQKFKELGVNVMIWRSIGDAKKWTALNP